ncbi:MAG TPA: hypothetical protein PLC86_13265, partial [Candidatus Accumulibacter phosphatis]|nr:hypothetical protein [Candidatus Accumulibacter phosphatis]
MAAAARGSTACGASFRKWTGRCEACGAWNSLLEEGAATAPGTRP